MTERQLNLPHGWDCKLDENTGRYYYVNHYTKTTTWEDPRNRHRPFTGAHKSFSNIQTEHIPLQDMKPRMSPLTVKSKVQETPLTTVSDADDPVAKISAMFPTVSETHIKVLLKNCRYMKSVFPQADETIILEVLQNNENNIQKTADALKDMGFDKKDTVKVAQQKMEAKKEQKQKKQEVRPPTPPVVMKTAEEKKIIKTSLQEKYKDVAEHLISIALESVNFDENRASQILQILIQEDTQPSLNKQQENQVCGDASEIASTSRTVIPSSQSRQSIKSMLKAEKELDKTSFSRVIEENESAFRSTYLSNTKGPNPENAKGANDNLVLENYLKWQGPNLDVKKGPQGLARGPDSSLLSGRNHRACGPNNELRKGSKLGLAKGSIFSHLQCTVRVGDSRGN